MPNTMPARARPGLVRRLLRLLWRVASLCIMGGMALAPTVPPPPPPPPAVEMRVSNGQPRSRPNRRAP